MMSKNNTCIKNITYKKSNKNNDYKIMSTV